MFYTFIGHRKDVKMFNTQSFELFADVISIMFLWSKRVYGPWKIGADLFFTIILKVFNLFSENCAREKEQSKLYHHDVIFKVCTLIDHRSRPISSVIL